MNTPFKETDTALEVNGLTVHFGGLVAISDVDFTDSTLHFSSSHYVHPN